MFHADTRVIGSGRTVTSGGRVTAVSATSDTLDGAVRLAYDGVSVVQFERMFCKRDIAQR